MTTTVRTIASVSVARSDYGIYLPIYRRILANPHLRLHLIVAGAHLSHDYGCTVRVIEQDGIPIADRVPMPMQGDSPLDVARAMGAGVTGFAEALARATPRPDVLLVLGDRYEMLAAVCAALPLQVPVAHLHGGEATQGAIDEQIRHAITKMSHLHFASLPEYGRRLVQMGEQPNHVFVTGAPALDHLHELPKLTREQVCAAANLRDPGPKFLVVIYHPVTLAHHDTPTQIAAVLDAVRESELPAIISYPNTDTANRVIIHALQQFVAQHPQHQLVTNLASHHYYGLLTHASALVGNSSSGIIEAASFKLPVVNIGPRQQGRIHGVNVLDVPCDPARISSAIARAISPEFRASLRNLVNPYGDGHASQRVVEVLQSFPLGPGLLVKRFHDLPA